MTDGFICGPSRGHYGRPYRIDGPRGVTQWVSAERSVKPPRFLYCWHPKHSARRRRFAPGTGYVQRWTLTKRELHAAIRDWDVFSLDMPARFVCSSCAQG